MEVSVARVKIWSRRDEFRKKAERQMMMDLVDYHQDFFVGCERGRVSMKDFEV